MWRRALDPYVTVIPAQSSRILPIILELPGHQTSIHINIYLPTAGKEALFMDILALLQATIEELCDSYPNALVYVRGDANATFQLRTNNKRDKLFHHFCSESSLSPLDIPHKTYHHFTGNGESDSNIDVVLQSSVSSNGAPALQTEQLLLILCSNEDVRLNSHHDVIISSVQLPHIQLQPHTPQAGVPRLENTRHKIVWSEDTLEDYSELVSPALEELRAAWLDETSPSSISILLSQTNQILTMAAKSLNKVIDLSRKPKPKKTFIPPDISSASTAVKNISKSLQKKMKDPSSSATSIDTIKTSLTDARSLLQNLKRRHALNLEMDRDTKLNSIISSKPQAAYNLLRSNKKDSNASISKLVVGDSTFTGAAVADGFHQSISSLKKIDPDKPATKTFSQFLSDHSHITEICKAGRQIPEISLTQAQDLLLKMKPTVTDYFSITSLHYLNGGIRVIKHFMLLLNAILKDINNYALAEINTVHAAILYKGHGKDKNHDRSYRTISTCPFIAKCLDSYVGDQYQESWNSLRAETQFQAEGLSHEHSALLLTETINYSIHVLKQPVFCLYLDARSAFDRVVREILIRRMYLDGTADHALLYFDQRLANRRTIIEWDKELLSPIADEQGVEQGGIKSGDLYKIYNNEQLTQAQRSKLGINIGNIQVASAGQADDVVLLSSDIYCLSNLLSLTMSYCSKYHVALSHEKTRLQVFAPQKHQQSVQYWNQTAPISIDSNFINFVDTAEHVGILRSIHGNQPHILKRISSHKRALSAVLSSGLARHHRANPASSLRTEQLYGLPVLLSGVASLTLLKSEKDTLDLHYKTTLESLLKIHAKTPRSFVFFMSGSLPLQATLDLRQLGLFAMISRLKDNILNRIAKHLLVISQDSSRSWFVQIKEICQKYQLPHPLTILESPPSKIPFKLLAKRHVQHYWEVKLREEAAPLDSLIFFQPKQMSLHRPHPLITTCGSNSYEVNKCVIQLKMLSGRYRSDSLLSNFHPSNSSQCQLACDSPESSGDLPHLLIHCSSLAYRRSVLFDYWKSLAAKNPVCSSLVSQMISASAEILIQFILDCSAIPEVASLVLIHGDQHLALLFKMTRTFCYSIHRERLKLLNRWRV